MRSRASQGCGEHQHQLAWRAGREGALGGEGRLDVAVRRVREVRRVVVLAELVLRVEEVLPGEPEVEDAPADADRGVGDEDDVGSAVRRGAGAGRRSSRRTRRRRGSACGRAATADRGRTRRRRAGRGRGRRGRGRCVSSNVAFTNVALAATSKKSPSARTDPDQPVRVEPLASVLRPWLGSKRRSWSECVWKKTDFAARSTAPSSLRVRDAEVLRLDVDERGEQPLRDVARVDRANAVAGAERRTRSDRTARARACRAA